jgi:hypothetical protein
MTVKIALLSIVGVALTLNAATISGSIETENQPQLFLPELLGAAGQITLTPGFSPDGNTLYFAQTECTPI